VTGVVVPIPSWPLPLSPQHNRAPDRVIAQTCDDDPPDTSSDTGSSIPRTGEGVQACVELGESLPRPL
jgi:hypothetical protein